MFDLTFAPPLNWIYLALVVLVPMIGIAEYKGWFQLEYSKFRPTHGGMSSRVGMFILYLVPIPVYLWLARGWLDHATTTQWLLSAAMIGHFAKRCLEVLFLHKYSGPIGVLTVVQITLIYSLASALGGYLFARAPALDALFAVGALVFLIGETGNFTHHKILADLRARQTGYFVPQAGLFRFVTCPHYFFEIVAWIGMALMSHQWAMLLLAFAMHNYLAARAWKTREWYRARFADYPRARRCMTPGLLWVEVIRADCRRPPRFRAYCARPRAPPTSGHFSQPFVARSTPPARRIGPVAPSSGAASRRPGERAD